MAINNWKCPQCDSIFKFHNGPPSSGGPLSRFTEEAANRMWQDKDACCFQTFWTGTWDRYEY